MIIPSLARTGPVIVAQILCEEYVRLGHKCKVFYFDDIVDVQMPCEVERIKFSHSFDFENWNIIHSHMIRPDAYVWYHQRNIKRAKVKCVSTLHNPISFKVINDTYPILSSLIGAILWPIFLSAHSKIIVLNKDTLSNLEPKLQIKSEVIFNGENVEICNQPERLDCYENISKLKEKYKIVGSVCSLTRRKGLSQIVRALQNLPDYAFVVLGKGDQLEPLKQMALSLGVEDRCLFLGFKSNATDYMSMFDIFVMCSYSEGYPLALIEAAAYGLPTVLSDIGILKAIVNDDVVNFYHLDDIDDLMDKIIKAYDNRIALGSNLNKLYARSLTGAAMADNYLQTYSKLLS